MIGTAFYTLGCKLNQLETESIADAFRGEGFTVFSWGASFSEPCLLIINTCTVTSHAEQKARHVIRKALRDYPQSILIITGCYAQMDAAVLETMDNVHGECRVFVVPGERKDGILDLPFFLKNAGLFDKPDRATLKTFAEEWISKRTGSAEGSFRFKPNDFSFHSRAFLKIQDGCDKRCSYCRVSLARGKSRSEDAKELLSCLKALEEQGYAEAVLTGVNISQYRGGEGDCFGLPGLLEYLLCGTKKIRLRLSSLEPEAFVPEFFLSVSHERIRPHFHLSAQSFSSEVLERMGRPGTLDFFEDAILRLRESKEDPFLACDIITGFPGETPSDFERTYDFCKKTDFAWIHAFPFSRRPGTAAWNLKGRVSEREAGLRVSLLTELAWIGRRNYVKRWTEKETELVLNKKGPAKTYADGVTANYLKVRLRKSTQSLPGRQIMRCRILEGAGEGNDKRFDAEAEIIL